MEDEEPVHESPVMLQLAEIWSTVQLKSVWKVRTHMHTRLCTHTNTCIKRLPTEVYASSHHFYALSIN
jgi:hypothetical protein